MILLLACLWAIIAFLVIQSTYAKYVTSVNGTTNVDIASWNMLVNNQNILNDSNLSLLYKKLEEFIKNDIY